MRGTGKNIRRRESFVTSFSHAAVSFQGETGDRGDDVSVDNSQLIIARILT